MLWGLGCVRHHLHILSFHAVCGAAGENVWNINVKMIQGILWLSRFAINMSENPSGPDYINTFLRV